MPRRFAVRATRTAISPRLAMRIFSNTRASSSCFRLGPVCRALVEERHDPLLPLRADAYLRDPRRCLFRQHLVDRMPSHMSDEILCRSDRFWTSLQQLAEDAGHRRVELAIARNTVHQTDAQSFLRVEA